MAPVAEHIDNGAAALLPAIVPGRTLPGLPVLLENPVAELTAHREDSAKETAFNQAFEFAQTGEKEFILHDAVPDASSFRAAHQIKRIIERCCGQFFAVDMFSGCNRRAHAFARRWVICASK
jgi:hypothetical protein